MGGFSMMILVLLISFLGVGHSIDTSDVIVGRPDVVRSAVSVVHPVARVLHLRNKHAKATADLLKLLYSMLEREKKQLVIVELKHKELWQKKITLRKEIRVLHKRKVKLVTKVEIKRKKCSRPGHQLRKCEKHLITYKEELTRITKRYKSWQVLSTRTVPKLEERISHLRQFKRKIKSKL